jgi:hypothetical protein
MLRDIVLIVVVVIIVLLVLGYFHLSVNINGHQFYL